MSGGTLCWSKARLNYVADGGYRWIGPAVPFVEIAIGGLFILGLFTGVAAAAGLLMNVSFPLRGSAGVNPVFALTAGALIAAWRVAGYYGLDYWALPLMGVLWSRRSQEHDVSV